MDGPREILGKRPTYSYNHMPVYHINPTKFTMQLNIHISHLSLNPIQAEGGYEP